MYTATFSRPETLTETDAKVLRMTEEGGPLRIEEVTDVCVGFGVSAKLFDPESGRCVGRVGADGNYRLG